MQETNKYLKTPAKESTVIRTKTHKKHTHTKQKSQHNLRLETTAASETFPQTQGPLPHVALLRRRHGAIVADDTSTDRREGPAWHLLSVVLWPAFQKLQLWVISRRWGLKSDLELLWILNDS